jgi:RNA polymerase sigma factor (sigma-70 family)
MSTEPDASRQPESRDQSHQQPSEAETGEQDASRPSTDEYTRKCERLRALLARCKQGDQLAWQQLHEDWDGPIRLIIRSRLRRAHWYARCQRRFGDSDLCQEAWKTLHIKLAEVDEHLTPELFLFWVTRVSDNLVRHAHRDHCLTEKRAVDREEPIPTSLQRCDRPPDQVVEAKDAWDSWLDTLPPERRRLAMMLRQGHTHEEVATALGLSVRTVERWFDEMRDGMLAHWETW